MPAARFITGLDGAALRDDERRFLRDAQPAGLILFARNCLTRDQLYRLVSEARDAIGREDTLVLIDQEGERVQRLKPPEWRALPNAADFIARFAGDPDAACGDAQRTARLIAHDLREVGITGNCAPVLDRPVPDAHDIIGVRAFGDDADTIIPLARAFAAGLTEGGVVPIGKHVPGHGRARADTHLELAVVETAREELVKMDFAVFKACADLPAMMTAHVVYAAIDDTAPASTSPRVHAEIIRGTIGFDGLLMSDDIGMAALEGIFERRTEQVISAGSDLVLHCSGLLREMEAVASAAPRVDAAVDARINACIAITTAIEPFDQEGAEAQLAGVLERRTGA
ncbi:MAG: beta-N-acetylhexosaminidase [Pseudomonadota bacterium]